MSREDVSMQEGSLKKIDALKLFYRTQVNAFPIVDRGRRIIGVMQKSDVVASFASVEDVNFSIKELIRECRLKEEDGLSQLLKGFGNASFVPVIDVDGRVVDFWSKIDVILAWEGMWEEGIASSWNILEQLPHAVIVTDIEKRILYINKEAKKIFEKGEEEILSFLKNAKVPSHAEKINICKDSFFFDASWIEKGEKKVGILYTFYKQKTPSSLSEDLKEQERLIIEEALYRTEGCVSKCAKLLNIPRQTLQYKIRKHGIKYVSSKKGMG